MLPPPFNLVPTAFFLLHSYHICQKRDKLTAKTAKTKYGAMFESTRVSSSSSSPPRSIWSRFWGANVSIAPSSSAPINDESANMHDRATSSLHLEGELTREGMTREQQAALDTLSSALSLSGTAADIFAGVLMAFMAPWIEMVVTIRTKTLTSFSLYTTFRDVVFTIMVFISVYVPFVVSLVYEALRTYTVVKLVLDEAGPSKCKAIFVRYDEVAVNDGPVACEIQTDSFHKLPQGQTISVRVIKTFGLNELACVSPRNPIIRIRAGSFEALVTDCVRQEDGSDLWSHKV